MGSQMFLHSVAWYRNSSPAPCNQAQSCQCRHNTKQTSHLLRVHPIARLAVVDPGALEVLCSNELNILASFGCAKVPHGLEVLVLGEILGQVVAWASQDVDDSAWKIRGVEHLVEVECNQRVLLAGDNDDGVAANDGRGKERYESKERELIGAGNAEWANSLVHLDSGTVEGRLLYSPSILVGISTPVEEAVDGCINL